LEVMGLFLSRIQGIAPSTGIIYHGLQCVATTVRFTSGLRAAEELVDGVTRMQRGDAAQRLLLNPHCPACEFRRQCQAQAVEQDTLSLLGA
jgi:predicted RecB family nuclease